MSRRLTCIAALLSVTLACSGCSIRNYNYRMRKAKEAFAQGRFADARDAVTKKMRKEEGRLNPWLELAVIDRTAGDFEQSAASLERAREITRHHETKAVVSATKTAATAATLIVNERAAPYTGDSFEKIMVHALAATNYLMIGRIDFARVEVMRGYQKQKDSADDHEKQLRKAREESSEKNVDDASLMAAIDNAYADQNSIATRVANAYQNAYLNFLSAVIFNTQSEPGNAYLEIKKANALRPGVECLRAITIETAVRAGFHEDLPRWRDAFDADVQTIVDEAREAPAELIVVFENGWAPVKNQITIPIPTPVGVFTIAIPKNDPQPAPADALEISVGGQTARTEVMADIEAQAVRALRDRMKVYVIKMAIRITARLLAQRELKKKMEKEYGDAGAIGAFLASSAMNVVLEQADRRSWTLLPREIQVARLRLPEGEAEATLRLVGGTGEDIIPLRLRADRPNIILARATDGLFIIHSNAPPE